jgi:hypothetical protein
MLTMITPTVKSRAGLLLELAETVAEQTQAPDAWSIRWDTERVGPAAIRNELAFQAHTEWVFPFDDDDLLMPWHFEVLYENLDDDADVVWTIPRTPGSILADEALWPPFDSRRLEIHNTIAAAAAIRRELFLDLGGYQDEPEEDWRLWQRMAAARARFRQVHVETWIYRIGGDWPHRSEFGKAI